jgi:hypothetical protein
MSIMINLYGLLLGGTIYPECFRPKWSFVKWIPVRAFRRRCKPCNDRAQAEMKR